MDYNTQKIKMGLAIHINLYILKFIKKQFCKLKGKKNLFVVGCPKDENSKKHEVQHGIEKKEATNYKNLLLPIHLRIYTDFNR